MRDLGAGRDVDETQLNRLVVSVSKVAANYGIRFPREFALLVKQVLYFDRYTRLLAPDLDVLNDERLSMNQPPAAAGAGAAAAVEAGGAEAVVAEVASVEVIPPAD